MANNSEYGEIKSDHDDIQEKKLQVLNDWMYPIFLRKGILNEKKIPVLFMSDIDFKNQTLLNRYRDHIFKDHIFSVDDTINEILKTPEKTIADLKNHIESIKEEDFFKKLFCFKSGKMEKFNFNLINSLNKSNRLKEELRLIIQKKLDGNQSDILIPLWKKCILGTTILIGVGLLMTGAGLIPTLAILVGLKPWFAGFALMMSGVSVILYESARYNEKKCAGREQLKLCSKKPDRVESKYNGYYFFVSEKIKKNLQDGSKTSENIKEDMKDEKIENLYFIRDGDLFSCKNFLKK